MDVESKASVQKLANHCHVLDPVLPSSRLVTLPAWRGLQGIVHLVFTTRRELPTAVRALIDHLAAGFPRQVVAGMP